MTQWDTNDTGNVAAHEFGHMLGHPDEYADATCPSKNPVNTGTVMDDNTETVARLYNRICTFHGSGHAPIAGPAPEPEENAVEVESMTLIDNLVPARRAAVLDRLRSVAEGGEALDAPGATQVTFEVMGGAPGCGSRSPRSTRCGRCWRRCRPSRPRCSRRQAGLRPASAGWALAVADRCPRAVDPARRRRRRRATAPDCPPDWVTPAASCRPGPPHPE
jgi:hypothetical protein